MGFYSNAGQNIASTEITDIAKLGGAVAGLAHVASAVGTKNNVELANEVKSLGEEEVKITESTNKLEAQRKDLEATNEKLTKTETDLASQKERYSKLQAETGMNNPTFKENWDKATSSAEKARSMYNKSMDQMKKKAELLDMQRKNFETRKKLIYEAVERSGK